jgi:nitrate reductase alpha subunit
MLPASALPRYAGAENGDFKFLVWDRASGPRMPQGSLGFRWQQKKGQWNLEMKDGVDGSALDPRPGRQASADYPRPGGRRCREHLRRELRQGPAIL